MKRLGKKLTLSRETVRELTNSEMQRAVGASTQIGCPYTSFDTCPKTSCATCSGPTCGGYSCVGSTCPQTPCMETQNHCTQLGC